MTDINKKTIRSYLQKLNRRGDSPFLILKKLAIVDKFLNWANQKKLIEDNVFKQIKEEIDNIKSKVKNQKSKVDKEKLEEDNLSLKSQKIIPTISDFERAAYAGEKKSEGILGEISLRFNIRTYKIKSFLFGWLKSFPLLHGKTAPQETQEKEKEPPSGFDFFNLGIHHYIGLIFLLVFLGFLGAGLYNNFFLKVERPFAYPLNLTRGGRVLSFQGRLTDSLGNPITTATNVQFKLYNVSTAGTPLYTAGPCSITPDQDGIFSTLIGSDCGSEIPHSVFTENPNVYLGVTVGSDSEMTPRQPIANVGYAINAETLQGFPPGEGTSNIPFINKDGDLLIAVAAPGIRSTFTSADFTLSSAKTAIIQSAAAGDVILQATGSGVLRFRTAGNNDSYTQMIIDNNGNVGIGNLSPNQKLEVSGNIYANSGQIRLGNFSTAPTAIGAGSMYYDSTTQKVYYYNGSVWTEMGAGSGGSGWWTQNSGLLYPINSTLDLAIGGNATSSAKFAFTNINSGTPTLKFNQASAFDLVNSTVNALDIEAGLLSFDTQNSRVGIGTTTPSTLLDVAGYASLNNQINIRGLWTQIQSTDNDIDLEIKTAGTGDIYLNPGGNVGIGTSSPNQKLEVSGNVRITGLTASLPVKTNASKDLISGAINLASSEVSGILPTVSGGTGLSSYNAGDMIYYASGTSFNQLPIGSANHVLYSTGSAPAWGTISGSSITPDSLDFTEFQDTLDLDANLILNQTNYTWTQNFTGTTTTGFTINANSLTSGKGLYLSSTSTGLTGNLAEFILSGSNAANTGNVVRIAQEGTSSVAVPLMVTNLGAGLSFRVNDETGDNDTTPFVIDASGNVGIGTTSPAGKLDVRTGSSALHNLLLYKETLAQAAENTYQIGIHSSRNLRTAPSINITEARNALSVIYRYVSGDSAYLDETRTLGEWGGSARTLLQNTNDYLYFGHGGTFTELYFDIVTAGVGYANQWEYWDGSSWTALTVSDGTSNLSSDGWVTWTAPGNWATTTVGPDTTARYYIRVKTTTTPTTVATAYYSNIGAFSSNFLAAISQDRTKFYVDTGGQVVSQISEGRTGFLAYRDEPRITQLGGYGFYYSSQRNIDSASVLYLDTARESLENIFFYDGSAFTDRTAVLKSWGGTAYSLIGDNNDYFYFGNTTTFSELYFNINTAGAGYNLVWEYWDGSSWAALTVSDGTNNFSKSGWVFWTSPANWATNSVNGVTRYWIRVSTTTNPTTTATTDFADISGISGHFARFFNHNSEKFRVDYLGQLYTAGIIFPGSSAEGSAVQTSNYLSGTTTGIGIGTTSPSYKFDVDSSTTDSIARFLSSDDLAQILISDDDTTGYFGVKDSRAFFGLNSGLSANNLVINSSGNVGIGTTNPSAKLDVAGNLNVATYATVSASLSVGTYDALAGPGNALFSGSVGIGTTNPTNHNTRLWVQGNIRADVYYDVGDTSNAFYLDLNSDSSFGGNLTLGGQITFNGNLDAGGNTINLISSADTAVCVGDTNCAGKIDAGTVDPPYTINGKKYATYLSAMIGVKEETTGTITLTKKNNLLNVYEYIIDFATQKEGSDLWLFSKTTNLRKNIDKMTVLLTPENNTRTWYKIDKEKFALFIYSNKPTSISYRLTAPRFDYEKWGNENPNGSVGFVINDPDLPSLLALNEKGDIQKETVTLTSIPSAQTGNLWQDLKNKAYQLISTTQDLIEEIGYFQKILAAKIQAGLVQAENTIIENTLLAKNIIAKEVTSYKLQVTRLFVEEKIISPVVETEEIQLKTQNPKLKTTTQKATLSIVDKDEKPVVEFKTDEKKTAFTGDIEINSHQEKGKLAQIVLKNLEGKTAAVIDASGNASFSGSLIAQNLSAETATVSGLLTAGEASLSGKLIAKEVEAENITSLSEELKNQNSNVKTLNENINEIQQLLAEIKNQPLPDLTNQTNLSQTNAIGSSISNVRSLMLDELTVTGQSNLYNVSVSGSLLAGQTLIENNSIIALTSELKLSALEKINLFDGAVAIAKDGTITTKGELIAQGGIQTNKIAPIGSKIRTVLEKGQSFTVENNDIEVASIDASGSAYFKNIALEKFTPATPEASIIAAPDNFAKNGIFAPAIEASASAAGTGVIPKTSQEVIIYSSFAKPDSLIYLTPKTSQPISLSVFEKKDGFFRVIRNQLLNQDIPFDWLIIN